MSLSNDTVYLLANNTTVGGDGTGNAAPQSAPTAEVAVPADGATSQATPAPTGLGGFMGPNSQLILTMVAVFAVMYFFTIRPQRKREKELREIQSSIKSGDWVMTFSGLYGKAVDVGADVVKVEFGSNKSIIIPVRKAELTKSQEPVLIAAKDEIAPSSSSK